MHIKFNRHRHIKAVGIKNEVIFGIGAGPGRLLDRCRCTFLDLSQWLQCSPVKIHCGDHIFVFLIFCMCASIKRNYNCRAGRNGPWQHSLSLREAFSIYFFQQCPLFSSAPDNVLLPMVSGVRNLPRYCQAQICTFFLSTLPSLFP